MNLLHHVILFLEAVLNHFFTLAAGCAVTVAAEWSQRYWLKRERTWKLDLGLVLIFILFACFQAWQDQYVRSESLNSQLAAKPAPTSSVSVYVPPITVPPAQVVVERGMVDATPQGTLIIGQIVPDFTHVVDEKKIGVSVSFENPTDYTVHDIISFAEVAVGPDSENHVQSDFEKRLADYNSHRELKHGVELGPHRANIMTSASTPALKAEWLDGVVNGSEKMYVLVWARWTTQNGMSGRLRECWRVRDVAYDRPTLEQCEVSR